MSSPSASVIVVGSSNMDLISYVDRLPRMGETIHGLSCAYTALFLFVRKFGLIPVVSAPYVCLLVAVEMGFGGKGANQAAMAAKMECTSTNVQLRDVFMMVHAGVCRPHNVHLARGL
jgi:sugar/nucleoside kinase (ribokinase family)